MDTSLLLLNNHSPSSGSSTIQPLRTRGDCFEFIDGTRVTIKECTDFKLFHNHLIGRDIRPVLEQRANLGFNMKRVLGSCHNMFHLHPREFPQYLLKLDSFFKLNEEYNSFVEFTVFADAPFAIPGLVNQIPFWIDVGAIASENLNALLELVNENNVHWNTIETGAFHPFPGVLCSHGSNGSQSDPVRPWWDYEDFHTNDAHEWWRKGGHNAMEYSHGATDENGNVTIIPSHIPILTNEKTRPDKDGIIQHHEDDARASALLCAGSCYHSEQGKFSELFTGRDLEFAKAFIKGANSINLEAQEKNYVHRRDLEGIVNNQPTKFLRVYQKGNEGRMDHMVFIRF